MELEIRHARIVVALAETKSISRAAAKLLLPQPSLSAQLRRIEKAVGGDLFVRSMAGISPTPLGERMIPMMASLVEHADMVIDEVSSPFSETLRMGFAEEVSPDVRAVLAAELGDARLETVTLAVASCVDAVRKGLVSAVMINSAEPVPPADVGEPALAEEVVLHQPIWAAQSHGTRPVFAGDAVTWEDLAGEPWVLHARGHWLHEVERELFGDRIGQMNVLHRAGGNGEALAWVREAGAVTLVTPMTATPEVHLTAVRQAPRSRLSMVWHRGSVHPRLIGCLLDALRHHYADQARAMPRYWGWIQENVIELPALNGLLDGRPGTRPSRPFGREVEIAGEREGRAGGRPRRTSR